MRHIDVSLGIAILHLRLDDWTGVVSSSAGVPEDRGAEEDETEEGAGVVHLQMCG